MAHARGESISRYNIIIIIITYGSDWVWLVYTRSGPGHEAVK